MPTRQFTKAAHLNLTQNQIGARPTKRAIPDEPSHDLGTQERKKIRRFWLRSTIWYPKGRFMSKSVTSLLTRVFEKKKI